MIVTSSHRNWQSSCYKTFAISGNRGKDANYEGECYPKLAPKKAFWEVWHSNIGKIPEEENNKFYIEEYYKQVLSSLDPETVYNELNNSALLCYESPEEFCHRHIVAAWLEILLDVNVPETKAYNYIVDEIERPKYIKEYLEEVIRKENGFDVLKLSKKTKD